MSRRRRVIEQDLEASFELDLAPMLALMVTLIPIMLLSTVFVKVNIVETSLPQVVQQAIEEDRKKKDRVVLVRLDMSKKTGFSLLVTEDGKTKKSIKLPNKEGKFDLDSLHRNLVEVKVVYPKIFRLDLKPAEDVPYNEIVKVMDEARATKTGDPTLHILDKSTNQNVETDVMFPDVIFSNVIEG